MPRPTATWMPLYIADYVTDTVHLNCTEHGAYLQLIMTYWRTGPLPDDDAYLSKIIHLPPRKWAAVKPTIMSFFQYDDGRWRHQRIDAELNIALENAERQKRRTANATLARTQRNDQRNVDVTDNVTFTSSPSPEEKKERDSPLSSPLPGGTLRLKPKRVRSVIPADWQPSPEFAHALDAAGHDWRSELEKFRDHFTANGKPMADFQAAFRNWLRRAAEFARKPAGPDRRAAASMEADRLAIEYVRRMRGAAGGNPRPSNGFDPASERGSDRDEDSGFAGSLLPN